MRGLFKHEESVEKQLCALEVSRFDIEVRSREGSLVSAQPELFLAQVKDMLDWLHEMNLNGNTIRVRPHGEHGLSLLTGLDPQQVSDAHVAGYEAAAVLEYAQDRYQMWLKHDRKLSAALAARVNGHLAAELGADAATSKWNGYGYLAGFVQHESSTPFLVQLVGHEGVVFSRAAELNDRLAAG